MNISPFSSEFASLSQPQIMWAIANFYKDQYEDLEKYKLICRFVNPTAAREIWDGDSMPDTTSTAAYDDFLGEVQKHTKSKMSNAELSDRLLNPEIYDVDTIQRVK